MRNRTTTLDIKPIYSYKEDEWQKCPSCRTKLFKILEKKGSVIEIKCKCGSIEKIEI